EVQQDEDLFSTGFNLFGEPYKVSTNKGDALANRVQNTLGNYDEMKELLTSHSNQSHLVGIPKNSVPQTPVEKPDQPGFFPEAQRSRAAPSQPGSHSTSMPPPPANTMPGSSVVHGHQGKKSRSSDWSRGGHCSSGAQTAQPVSRGKHSSHEQTSSRHDQDQEDSIPNPDGPTTSSHSNRKQAQSGKGPATAELGLGKSPAEQDLCSHGSNSPMASTSLIPSGLLTPTFPQGLHCKPSSAVQQKPTAYVRPMDGQDQVPNDSPELKPPVELVEGYNSVPFGGLLDTKSSTAGTKGKIPKLTLPQSGEVSVTVYRLSQRAGFLQMFLPGTTQRTSEPTGHSSGASGSSSESESSSESDSDSDSSSSDSECNRASRAATPEPEPPSTNKWQLDKWLNKVNPHNKALINNQSDSHVLNSSQPDESQASENQGSSKSKPSTTLAPADPKERTLLNPIREKAKPKTGQKAPDSKSTKVKSPASVELAPQRRSTGKKQPKKVERSSSSEEHNWPRPLNSSSTPKEKEPPPLEPPKPRGKGPGVKTAPRKEPRTTTTNTKHRGPNKIIPKSKEFIETESSSSECHSDPEELTKVQIPCPGPNTLSLKSKDCNSNILNVSSLTSTSSTSIPDPGALDLLEESLFSPIPIVQNELLSPLREFEDIKSLWVKIELSFLSRIPGQGPPEPPPTKAECREVSVKHRRQQSPASIPAEKNSSRSKRKHKASCLASARTETFDMFSVFFFLPSSLKKQPRKREDKLLPPLLSPLSDEPVGRPRRSSECSSLSQEGNTSTVPNSLPSTRTIPASTSSSSSSSHKHRKGENKALSHSKTSTVKNYLSLMALLPPPMISVFQYDFTSFVFCTSLYLRNSLNSPFNANFASQMDKFGKAVNYADGALSFIECGNAMERDPLEAKSPYTMYSETVELIRYAMRLKNFTSHSATIAEKKLAVLCNRCLSLLYFRMFKLKKDHAMKYSRSLMEYFKNSAKSSQAPSPWGANGKYVTGTPSPMSLSPSPVSSVSSGAGVMGSSSASGSVAIPQRIHHMAASHVNITNNILRSYEHWETADKLAQESQEFFLELDSVMEPLTQHSSMTELVRYIGQGLHWLRLEAHLL
uniref:AF4/FMR2 family, member 2 n=1 Tax=Sinocyclocheilus anshuiensis TaxID=1608454 RepID=A0A671NHS7_9TELE